MLTFYGCLMYWGMQCLHFYLMFFLNITIWWILWQFHNLKNVCGNFHSHNHCYVCRFSYNFGLEIEPMFFHKTCRSFYYLRNKNGSERRSMMHPQDERERSRWQRSLNRFGCQGKAQGYGRRCLGCQLSASVKGLSLLNNHIWTIAYVNWSTSM
jgi:hypothetical protein